MPPDNSSVDKRLSEYRTKRVRTGTPEPWGGGAGSGSAGFAVHKHAARNLHFDLRLEFGGTLLSWAVPKGPSRDVENKRLAVRTEDHPVEYLDFEGVIPEGNYGAGAMILWDRGRWIPLEDPVAGLAKGKLLFELRGSKLKGVWTLFLTRKEGAEWILMKKPDSFARPDPDPGFDQNSVLSGMTVEELAQGSGREVAISRLLQEWRTPERSSPVDGMEVMLAETVNKPFDHSDFVFELKFDGFRLLAIRDNDRIVLKYRSGREVTRHYPDLALSLRRLPASSFVLDGELTLLNSQGRPDFQLLQRRAQVRSGVDPVAANRDLPVVYFVFDILSFGTFDLRGLPLTRRREILERLVPALGQIQPAPQLACHGTAFFQNASQLGFEGIMAKRSASPYRSGTRSPDWLKIPASRSGCFVIVGYTLPQGLRNGFAALHVAGEKDGMLVHAGRVGTGFNEKAIAELVARLAGSGRQTAPFSGPVPQGKEHRWVEPELICEVRYKEFTEAGQLRQPVFLGLRPDRSKADCPFPGPPETPREAPSLARVPLVRVSNPAKMLWPEAGINKQTLVSYYEQISPWMLPYLRDRLLVMDRYPDGIGGKSFFQQSAPDSTPEWIRTEEIWSQDNTKGTRFIVCENAETLRYLANLATIPIHVWASRVSSREHPDWGILDLDPGEAPFSQVVQTALEIHRVAADLGLLLFPKTSGSKGVHLLFPTGGKYRFDQVRMLAELLSRLICGIVPRLATVERLPENRGGKVYIDFLQNGYGKLLVAPFSVRPRPEATVSMPLTWCQLESGIRTEDFHIGNVPKLIREVGNDPLVRVLEESLDLGSVLSRLEDSMSKFFPYDSPGGCIRPHPE